MHGSVCCLFGYQRLENPVQYRKPFRRRKRVEYKVKIAQIAVDESPLVLQPDQEEAERLERYLDEDESDLAAAAALLTQLQQQNSNGNNR